MPVRRIGMKKQTWFILLSLLGFSLLVCLLDAVLHPAYFVKVAVKAALFLGLPAAYLALFREERGGFRQLFVPKRRGLGTALALAAGVYAVILGGYLLTDTVIDFSNVTPSLTAGMGITAGNFLWTALYISFVNSFLEELFFRGFGFITLKQHIGRRLAHTLSAALFAVYHLGMLWEMFAMPALTLLLAGLMLGGWIFNRLNEASGSVYPSWLVHMAANFAINTVGFSLFGLLPF